MSNKIDKPEVVTPSTNFLSKLIKGHYGLALTFWVWGVCGGFLLANILTVPLARARADSLAIPFIIIWFAYISMVFIGVWRSANSASLWGTLSKLFIIIIFPIIAFVLLYIIGLLTSDYPNH